VVRGSLLSVVIISQLNVKWFYKTTKINEDSVIAFHALPPSLLETFFSLGSNSLAGFEGGLKFLARKPDSKSNLLSAVSLTNPARISLETR
jgi:hypothetical protein